MRIIPTNPIIRILVSACFAFLAFGAWAFVVNQGEGQQIGLRAGLVQGGLSFVFTLVGSAIMEFMVRLSKVNWKRFAMAVSANLAVVYGFILGGHILNQTPNIFLTILPGLVITLIYCFSYSWFITYGESAAGNFKILQLIAKTDNADSVAALELITESTQASPIEALRIIEEMAIGRKSSIYVETRKQQQQLAQALKAVGFVTKVL